MGFSFKNKKGFTISNAFQKLLDESNHKRNRLWVHKGCEFYNRSIKSWLKHSNKETCSSCSEGTFFVAKTFMRTFNKKIYKHMNSINSINKLIQLMNTVIHIIAK